MINLSLENISMKTIVFLIILLNFNAFGQDNSLSNKKYTIFPDEYSELDDIKTPIYTTDEYVLEVLNSSRRMYIQAIIHSGKKDTLKAENYFKASLEMINSLSSYPDIMSNTDFTDLALQIMEDYEVYANKTDLIDANSPLFLIKDKIYSDIEENVFIGELKTLKDEKIASPSYVNTHQPSFLTIPMPENDVVKKSIKWFTETKFGRKVFEVWYGKSSRWFPMMKRIAEEEGIPQEIVYLSMIESGLEPNAISKASAVGLWQFMYATGKDFKLNSDGSIWIDERRDPEKATRAAMQYLRYLHKEFGDWHLALAAYNCGQGRVGRAIKRSGKSNPTFWEISHLLPKETRYYVPKFISTALVSMEPHLYNFKVDTFKFHDEYKYDIYPINEPVSISAIAKCLNVSDSVIYSLNPELIRKSTPPNVISYNLKIPYNTKELFATNFVNLTQEEKQPFVEHNVATGETIAKIARKYDISTQEIVELNGFKSSKTKLVRGAALKLPLSITAYEEINEAARNSGSYYPLNGSIDLVHYVTSGESLYRIARKYGVSIEHLVDMNNLRHKNVTLSIGQKLVVSVKDESEEEDEVVVSEVAKKLNNPIVVRHRVKYGETISDIASKYDTDVNQIKKDNRLRSNTLRNGTNLKIVTSVNPESIQDNISNISEKQIAFHYVRRGETLGRIASKYGMSVSELQGENALRGHKIYPGQKLKVQKTINVASNILISSSSSDGSNLNGSTAIHRVNKGESLYTISKKYNIGINDIKQLNNLSSDYIYEGQRLKLINNGTLPNSSNSYISHTVKKGETLGHIAENYNTTAQNLRNWNNISGSRIYPGQNLVLQAPAANVAQISSPKKVEYHTIRKGETLNAIANKYDLSVNQIKSWNNISGTNIRAGDRLVLNADLVSKGGSTNVKESSAPIYYSLKKGETLAVVANKFGLSLNQIRALNPNLNERNLQIGQKIKVK